MLVQTHEPLETAPRTRGSTFALQRTLGGGETAPRTRGSTQRRCFAGDCAEDCPAHAGIDPALPLCRYHVRGLPRARGDRPPLSAPFAFRFGTAPRTRGSTSWRLTKRPHALDCPAHAGIDPRRRATWGGQSRLPRARGDRPREIRAWNAARVTAPRTRGSTPHHLRARITAKDCPAHAGIDPIDRQCGRSLPRLPRARGDRPLFRD